MMYFTIFKNDDIVMIYSCKLSDTWDVDHLLCGDDAVFPSVCVFTGVRLQHRHV